MKLADFFVKIGVDADTLKVKDFGQAIGDIPLQVAGAVAALAGISFSIKQLAGDAMETAVGFQAFTNQTGLSSQELQRWTIISRQANVSAEAMTSSISGLQKQLAEIRLGRGNIAPFAMLGIDPKGNAFSVLRQLRTKLRGVDRATGTNLISQMGLSPEMMNVLTLSESRFREFGNKVRGMSKQDEKAFLDAKLALEQFGLQFKDFSYAHLAPAMRAFTDIVNVAQEFKGALPGIAAGVLALTAAFAPLTAAVVTFIAFLDDLLAYNEGRNSLIGAVFGNKTNKASFKENISTIAGIDPGAMGNYIAESVLGALGIPKGKNIPGFIWEKISGKGDVNVDIRVDGSGSPHETAVAVGEHLKRTIDRTGTQTAGKQDRR